MQGNQGNQLQVNFIIEEYKNELAEIQNELIMVRAYAKQLEAQLAEATKENGQQLPEQVVISNESK